MTKDDFAVSPFTLVIDTREQAPYSFQSIKADAAKGNVPIAVRTVQATLATGDYSIQGLESKVTIERKSHEDLVSSISHGRRRFEAEFYRMSQMRYAAVVVEASIGDVLHRPLPHSKVPAKAVIRTALSWSIRYGVHWWFAPSRSHAEVFVYRVLEQFWRIYREQHGQGVKIA